MAVGFRAAGTADSANGGSLSALELPAGNAAGDVNILYVYTREVTDGSVDAISGWTQALEDRSSGGIICIMWRAWQSGDTAPTVTFTNHTTGASGDTTIGQIAAFTGCSTSAPIGTIGTVSTNASQADIGPISGITTGTDAAVVVCGGRMDDWNLDGAADLTGDGLTWAEIGEKEVTTGLDAGMVWDYALTPSGATVTDKTFSITGGTSQPGKGVMFELVQGGTEHSGAAVVAGVGTVAAHGLVDYVGAAAPAGIGTMATHALVDYVGAAAPAGVGTVAAHALVDYVGAAVPVGIGTMMAAGSVTTTHSGEAVIAGIGTMTADATVAGTQFGEAVVTGLGTVAANGVVDYVGAAVVAGIGTMTAEGLVSTTHSGEAVIAGLGTMTALGSVTLGSKMVDILIPTRVYSEEPYP